MTPEQTLRESYGRRVIAALASSMGAAAIGVGVASVMPAMPVAIALLFLLAGIAIHIAGMVIAHRTDAIGGEIPILVRDDDVDLAIDVKIEHVEASIVLLAEGGNEARCQRRPIGVEYRARSVGRARMRRRAR